MIIAVNNLSKAFNGVEKLNIPHLQINEKELVGIVGNNGAGKTTLFRLILNLLRATSGQVFIQDKPVCSTVEWKTFTGSFLNDQFLIGLLKPEEYFYYIGEVYGMSKKEINLVLMDYIPFMADEILQQKKVIDKFSKGNKQKIGIVSAMITLPKLLILDEPFNYLDPTSQIQMKRLLQNYSQKYQATILLSSHNLQYVTDICNRIIVLEAGHIIHNVCSPDEATKSIIENYFENRR